MAKKQSNAVFCVSLTTDGTAWQRREAVALTPKRRSHSAVKAS